MKKDHRHHRDCTHALNIVLKFSHPHHFHSVNFIRLTAEAIRPGPAGRSIDIGRHSKGNAGNADERGNHLHPVKPLADQNIYRNAAVLGLAFDRVIARQRVGLGHAGRGEHAIGLPVAGLL